MRRQPWPPGWDNPSFLLCGGAQHRELTCIAFKTIRDRGHVIKQPGNPTGHTHFSQPIRGNPGTLCEGLDHARRRRQVDVIRFTPLGNMSEVSDEDFKVSDVAFRDPV